MVPIQDIPQLLKWAREVPPEIDLALKRFQEALSSGAGPWDKAWDVCHAYKLGPSSPSFFYVPLFYFAPRNGCKVCVNIYICIYIVRVLYLRYRRPPVTTQQTWARPTPPVAKCVESGTRCQGRPHHSRPGRTGAMHPKGVLREWTMPHGPGNRTTDQDVPLRKCHIMWDPPDRT
jgi:hypothetical protein